MRDLQFSMEKDESRVKVVRIWGEHNGCRVCGKVKRVKNFGLVETQIMELNYDTKGWKSLQALRRRGLVAGDKVPLMAYDRKVLKEMVENWIESGEEGVRES